MKTIGIWKSLLGVLVFGAVCLAGPGAMAKEREISVSLKAPDGAWKLSIEEVRQVKEGIWVLAKVSREQGAMGIQMITTLKDKVKIEAPDLPVKTFVVGKTWNWKNTEPVKFIKSRKQIAKDFDAGKLLFKKTEKPTEKKKA